MAETQELMDIPESESDYLNIDWNSRVITIPKNITCIGVYNDKDTNRVYFRCPVAYGECRVADYGLHVNYLNVGTSGTQYDGDIYFVDDAVVDGDYMTFSWLVGRRAYLEEGNTRFIVCCKIVDADDNVVNELNTTVSALPVLEGLEVDVEGWEDEYPDYLEEILRRCEAAESAAENAIQGITVNGETAPVENHIAEITVSGGGDIEKITVNNVEQPIEDKTVNITVPIKVSELDNDSGYITDDALDGYAKDSDVESVKETAESALEKATETADTAITGINVNGDPAEVEDHIAKLTVAAEAPIEHISVNNVEQAIVDKTVNLDIDRAEVDEEEKTLIVGDITSGGTIECIKVNGTALAIEDNTVDISVPTKTSELTNDSKYITATLDGETLRLA